MRFLTSFLSIFIFSLIVIGVGFYFTREYILYRGVENFKKSVLVLRRSNASVCNTTSPDLLGVMISDAQPTIQLRFTSDTEYILEVICPGFEFDPKTLETKELDNYISKVPGSSGILLTEQRTGVELVAFKNVQEMVNSWIGRELPFIQKSKTVALENNNFVVVQPGESLGTGPVTSCEGFGYQCCQVDSQIGVGNKIEGLPGCEKTCYNSCQRRPMVLSFTSNPFFDIQTRALTISANESVDFNYVIDTGITASSQVFIDFGDGRSDQSLEKTGTFSHTYQCAVEDSCEYTAQIKATDTNQVESALTSVSQIKVVVTAN